MIANDHRAQSLPADSASAPTSGIQVRGASVTYRNGNQALIDASFETPASSITALVGMNGSGKSTLFKAIMGLVPLTAGHINLLGISTREALRRKQIAYVPQSEDVDWDFPIQVRDVVMMGRYGHLTGLRRAGKADQIAVNDAMERVGITALLNRQIGELSGGQKKRVFLARALAQNAAVILLDEPFTGVDVGTEDAIIALLTELKSEGRVILVSTHNLGSVPEFCDHAVLINRSVLAFGPTRDVFTRSNLAAAFGGVLRHFIIGDAYAPDTLPVGIFTDDERPLVFYGDTATARPQTSDTQGEDR